MKRRAVFMDLNGTLVMPITVERLADLTLVAGADTALAALSAAGFTCPVVTIQSRIAKGYFSVSEFTAWFRAFSERLAVAGAEVVGPYVCPHRFAEPCACKKPNTLLYEQAAIDHNLDLHRAFVIGDSARDVQAARRFGGRGILVRTGWGSSVEEVSRALPDVSYVATSLGDAVAHILGQR
jgi:histidinol-phosphate phosphatase family protein